MLTQLIDYAVILQLGKYHFRRTAKMELMNGVSGLAIHRRYEHVHDEEITKSN